MLVEVKLNLFVSDVDTELFKGVGPEILEAKDVQYTNPVLVFFAIESNKQCR